MSNGLVAGDHLEVCITVESYVAVEALGEKVDSYLELIAVLVHQTEVQKNRGDVRMAVSTHNLQNFLRSVQVLESLRPVSALVIVK